ncbi:MAG: hypothetical protein C0484_24290 [Rhodospirillum sp.]|nr:hypothetical protein [Rhodospirillum sp.]
MRKRGIGGHSKILEEELEASALAFAPAQHSRAEIGGLTTAALAAPLSVESTSSPAALSISNPVIVNAIDTTAFGIPDPSGLAFVPGGTPGTGALLLVDSEVNEPPFFGINNLFHFSLSMTFDHAASLKSFTIEPTGAAYDPLSGHLFISDDDANRIFEVDAGNPGVLIKSFSTAAYATDAEDVAFDPVSNHLLVLQGVTANPSHNTVFETTLSGTLLASIKMPAALSQDLEGIAYDPVNQVFYVAGGPNPDIWVVSRDGQTILSTITVLEGVTNTLTDTIVHPKGLLLAPSSDPNDDPGVMSLYVADFGHDNVMDGRMYEINLNGPTGQPALFTAGDDVTDLNTVAAGSYLAGSQYDALAGNDTVTLPSDAAAAAATGYNPVQAAFRSGSGNDTIIGGSLNDTIWGDGGNDMLKGGAGNDRLLGNSSADTVSGGLGNDFLDGGSNNDTASYAAAAGPITANLSLGTATGEGADTLLNLEHVTGSAFDDAITGSTLNNALIGGAGNDTVHGGLGNDTLTGGTGTDQLFGDGGHDGLKWDIADLIDGGDGFDTLDANLSSADTIDLRGANFTHLERIQTGSGKDIVTLSLNDVLSDTADNQFVVDLGSSSPDTLNIDTVGGWNATAPNTTLGPTGVAAGISVSGMTAYTFTNGLDTVTIFSNAEVVHAQLLS